MATSIDPAIKKAYEVSYALFRVAAILPSRSFAVLLEKEALNLLHSTAGNLALEAQAAMTSLHYLVSFGKDTGNVHPENAEVLIRQLESLASLMRERSVGSSKEVTAVDLSQIFSNVESSVAALPVAGPAAPSKTLPQSKPASTHAATHSPESKNDQGQPLILLSNRQDIILEKIRQSGSCRTRDLQAILPDLSERTLRYDLQRLVEEGKIERFGGGGPASWYRIKEPGLQSNISGGPTL